MNVPEANRVPRRPRVLFLVEGFTDIRFVSGLAGVCDLTLLTPAATFRSSELDLRMLNAGLSLPAYELVGGRFAYQIRSLRWIWKRSEQFDVILCQELLRGALNANLIGRVTGVPVVASVLVPAVEYFRCKRERRQIPAWQGWVGEMVLRFLLKLNGRLVTRCLAWGPYLLECARRTCAHAELGHYYGIDTTRFRPANAEERRALRVGLGLPVAAFLVLFPSRVSHEKDPETALRAVAGLRRLGVDARILNLGGGFQAFLQLAGSIGLPSPEAWVLGRPAIHPLRELPDYFRAVDVVCQSSLEEGLSLATLESLACGTPVVATEVGGMAVRLRGSAQLTPRRDSSAMTQALWNVAQDPARARAQALAGAEWVGRECSRNVAFAHWRETLRQVAFGSNPRS